MCVFSGFFAFPAKFGPSFGHRFSDLQEVPIPLFHCFLQWICNTSEVAVLKRTRGFRSAGIIFTVEQQKELERNLAETIAKRRKTVGDAQLSG